MVSVCVLQKSERRQQHALKETEFLRLKRSRLGVDDFESLKVIGRGAFGEVGHPLVWPVCLGGFGGCLGGDI